MTYLLSVAIGFVGGGLAGMFGLGGGIVLVPLLGLLLHVGQHQAQGMTLAVLVLPLGLPALLHYRRQGVALHLSAVLLMMAGFLMGVGVGAYGASSLPEGKLRILFSAFLAFMALRIWRRSAGGKSAKGEGGHATHVRAFVPLLVGLTGGCCSGLLGIGGGLVMIPMMVALLGYTQLEAQMASLAILLPPLGLPGVLIYAKAAGGLPWVTLAGVALGFVGGSLVGARAATRVRSGVLQRLFALLLGTVAVAMAWRGLIR